MNIRYTGNDPMLDPMLGLKEAEQASPRQRLGKTPPTIAKP